MELTVDVIKRRSGHYDVTLVALLDVSRMKIRRLVHLESCLNLLELNLTHNELRSLEGLPPLPLLRCLHLSNNLLTSLDSLPHLPLLEELTVAVSISILSSIYVKTLIHVGLYQNNQIRSIDFTTLATKLPSLRVLEMNGNPLDSSAESKASKAFPNLSILNGEALTLRKLFEEISSDDFGKTSDVVEDDPAEAGIELDDSIDDSKDNGIDVNEFITESTRNLEGVSFLII
ncbi:Nucleotide binding protein [Phytophthora palmivora]|uniref:Nucleotide binding protein n=1 Tax=Phytophthora palmivora TaxID=4796 RepID=A0A2P4YT78_9STRA|nr:Nucleotide binding protein [Phytophthora palmivora]